MFKSNGISGNTSSIKNVATIINTKYFKFAPFIKSVLTVYFYLYIFLYWMFLLNTNVFGNPTLVS